MGLKESSASAKRLDMMENGQVPETLLRLGLPTMVGMLVSASYNIVDTFFVGSLGTAAVGAVSIVFPISLVFLAEALFFGSGASSYLARLLGAGHSKEASECASTALFTSMGLGILLSLLLIIFLVPLLSVLGASDTMMPYAWQYGIIMAVAFIPYVFNATSNNIISSEGATTYSMVAMLVGGISHVVLDPLFIYGIPLGVAGVATASLLANCLSTAVYLRYWLGGKSSYALSLRNFRPSRKLYAQISEIGVSVMAYQLLCSVALALTNVCATPFGDEAVAALGIVSRVGTFFSMILVGFLKGYQPFVGYNYGRGDEARVRTATKTMLRWSTAYSMLVGALMIVCAVQIVGVFSNDAEVVHIGSAALVLGGITFTTIGYQMTYAHMFIGLGCAKEGGLISIGRQGLFFVPILLIASALFGLPGIVASQAAADACSLVLVAVLVTGHRKHGSVAVEEPASA